MSIYTLHHQVRQLDETLCVNGRKYLTGDVLFSGRGKRIILGESIAKGGEGSVFAALAASESPLVAKLYHPAQRIRWREQKLRLMRSRPVCFPCVAWPHEILYDELRCFAGLDCQLMTVSIIPSTEILPDSCGGCPPDYRPESYH